MHLYAVGAIRQGLAPEASSFSWAVKAIAGLVENHSCFRGARVVGSTARGAPKPTSDLDGVIVYRSERSDEAWALLTHLAEELTARHVPFEDFTFVSDEVWGGVGHGISAGYLGHLQFSAQRHGDFGWGEDVLSMIGQPNSSALDDALSYAARKRHKMSGLRLSRNMTWSSEWLKLAQEVATAPTYCLLRLIECGNSQHMPHQIKLPDGLIDFLAGYLPDDQIELMSSMLRRISQLKEEIPVEVVRIQAGGTSQAYEQKVNSLVSMSPLAYSTIEWCLERLIELHRERMDTAMATPD